MAITDAEIEDILQTHRELMNMCSKLSTMIVMAEEEVENLQTEYEHLTEELSEFRKNYKEVL